MYCHRCGREIQAQVRFCQACGADLQEAEWNRPHTIAIADAQGRDDYFCQELIRRWIRHQKCKGFRGFGKEFVGCGCMAALFGGMAAAGGATFIPNFLKPYLGIALFLGLLFWIIGTVLSAVTNFSYKRYATNILNQAQIMPLVIDQLCQLVGQGQYGEDGAVLGILADFGDQRAVPFVVPVLKDEDVSVRIMAARLLGILGDESAAPALREALSDTEGSVRKEAAAALSSRGWDIGESSKPL